MSARSHGGDVEDGDAGRDFQTVLKPLRKALRQEDLETALRFAGRLFEIGGSPERHEERKVTALLLAMEGMVPAVRTAFAAKILERFGSLLTEDARARIGGILERL